MPLTLITDIDYPGKHIYTITSLTSVGTVATAVTSITNALSTGQMVTISGATPAGYNGTFEITVTNGTTFTYPVVAGLASPASGTITAYGGKETVPGVVFLDGYFFVMTDEAVIYNSALGDGSEWNALDFITAKKEPGKGMAIGKSQNYLIAFKEWSTEFFYDAGNPVGSPLSPVDNGFILTGCAQGESVANLDGNLFWISRTRQKGRSVHLMAGVQSVGQISTPDVDRILNNDDLAGIYSYGVKIGGHMFYLLTLKTSGITLAYDMVGKSWAEWTTLEAQPTVAITSIVGGLVTTAAAHGLNDGDAVVIAGSSVSAYNGTHQAFVRSATTCQIEIVAANATGGTSMGYTETYFKYSKYVSCGGRDLVLHETNGHLYELTEDAYTDAGIPIDLRARTGKIDGDTTNNKTSGKTEVIGNKIASSAAVRWSDDDYESFSSYRPVDLNAARSQIRRCGDFRRRAFELRHVAATSLQVQSLELEGA